MIKVTLLLLSSLCLFNIAVHANPLTDRNTSADHKEEAGLGIGAIIGGLLAGPPGAIIGAAGGAWLGNKQAEKEKELKLLEQRLAEKDSELVFLQNEFSDLQSGFAQQVRKVKLEKRLGALKDLSRGVSLTVYFRSNSAEVDPEILARIKKLAHFLKEFPEIQIQLQAHADRRGHSDYNKKLSMKRAETITQQLIRAGLEPARIHAHAYGESRALSATGDVEGYVFDRRVNIQLTLNTET
jgi:sortase system peptidoglycan-associated protein